MAKRFKRIYVEITNSCNLDCSFCQETKRSKHYMKVDEFQHIIDDIKNYTNYIYLHVKGEPLLHPHLEEILAICEQAGIQVCITTNGTLLLDRLDILLRHPVKQINISFHSADDNSSVDIDQYVHDVFYCCNKINELTDTEISIRLWVTPVNPYIFGQSNIDIRKRLHINVGSPFEWPDTSNSYSCTDGTCQGLKSHMAILCDGSVVPCCLDGNGIVNLGNILDIPLNDILTGQRCQDIIWNFTRNRKAVEPLCIHCSYKERFKK